MANLIEVVYLNQENELVTSVEFRQGMSIFDAISHSKVLEQFPQINLEINKTGIFGKIYPLSHILSPNDRVEIYNPLPQDPKQMRWDRLHKQQKT